MKKYLVSAAAIAMAAVMVLSTSVWADPSQSRYFVDMNDKSYGFWAIGEVDGLFEAGIVKGVGDNKFGPANLMKRGDFVLMLENAFHYPTISLNKYNFADVKNDDYYFTAINNARGNGIVDDTPIFNPQNPIKRIDAFKMLYKTMNIYGCVGSNGSTDVSMYSDSDLLFNTQDKIAVGTITKLGIISGSNGELKPNDTVTRAEMAVMLSKTIEVYRANGSKEANTGTKQELKPVLSGAQANPDPDRKTDEVKKITETYTVEDGESAAIEGEEIAVAGGDGVIAKGSGTSLTIDKSKATTAYKGAKIISALNGAEVEITDADINASAVGARCVYVDEDSEATIESSKLFARYEDGSAIESKGKLDIKDSTVQAVKKEAIKLYDTAETNIANSTIIVEDKNSGILVQNDDGNYDTAVINLNDVEFKGNKKGSAIKVENAKTIINLKSVTMEGIKTLLETAYNYSRGIRNTEITINLDNQKLEGDINGDDMAVIDINLTNGSTYVGSLNYSNTAKSINLNISADSKLELTDDCYVDAITIDDERICRDRDFAAVIDDNGATIYYNADNHANDYLDDGTYALQNGGVITPISK